ncbi:hypothetical protein ACHAXT_003075 [Thalassiosira profunda]
MPRAEELEEFGLELESEHHSLIAETSAASPKTRRAALSVSSHSNGSVGAPPLAPASSRLRLHPGLLKWTLLIAACALVVFLNVGKEEEANEMIEGQLADDARNVSVANNQGGKTGKSSPAVDVGSFTLERLKATREAAQGLVDILEEYYSGSAQARRMLINAWEMPWHLDNVNATTKDAQRMDKLVDTIARALVSDDQKEFLIGTIGSSVAAGHDNCHYDSYENQMQRTFGPVWEAAGMTLTCQNAGEGGGCGDSHRNQVFCVQQNVSPDIDIVHYSWSYFEVGSDDALDSRESLIRWTQMLPKQPPVHVLNVLWKKSEKKEVELAEHYAQYGYNTYYMRTAHTLGGADYGPGPEEDYVIYENAHVGDGYHNVTRYGANESNPDRKASLGVVMRNWHPGPLGFELVADTFSFVYAQAMLKALALIETTVAEGKDPRDIWPAKRRIVLKSSLPKPIHCDPKYCVVDEAPTCLNYEKPTFGRWGARVEEPNGDLNPHKGTLQNWTVWNEPIDFWHMVGRQDEAVFQDRDDKEICRHLDNCAGMSATSAANGRVVFRLPKMEVGLVVICGCCGKDVAEEMFIQNERLEIRYNDVLLNRSSWDVFPNPKCARLVKEGGHVGPTGHAYLSVLARNLSKPVRISHLITL